MFQLVLINEIGLEKELWLLDKKGNILEPIVYGFPADEMGFLIEIRTEHSFYPTDIEMSLGLSQDVAEVRARHMGFRVEEKAYREVDKYFIEYISDKYKHSQMPDYTENVYGDTLVPFSMHTGFHHNIATAGLHVHFSSRLIEGNKCEYIKLDISKIVKYLDNIFKHEIVSSLRAIGEFEHKSHGFEYRSLPSTADIKKVIEESFKILNETTGVKANE